MKFTLIFLIGNNLLGSLIQCHLCLKFHFVNYPTKSPLIFILFVNSSSKLLTKAKFLFFSDDIKIFMNVDIRSICYILQNEWISLLLGCKVLVFNLMLANENSQKKCNFITFFRRHITISHPYSFNNIPLELVFLIKDLASILFAP